MVILSVPHLIQAYLPGVIKEFGEYCFFDEGLKDGVEFGDYTVPLDSIVEMKKVKDISDDKICVLSKDEADIFNAFVTIFKVLRKDLIL